MKKLRMHRKIPITFDINKYLFYYSHMKLFFELSHTEPQAGDEALLQSAISITKTYAQKGKISYKEDYLPINIFIKRFLEPRESSIMMKN